MPTCSAPTFVLMVTCTSPCLLSLRLSYNTEIWPLIFVLMVSLNSDRIQDLMRVVALYRSQQSAAGGRIRTAGCLLGAILFMLATKCINGMVPESLRVLIGAAQNLLQGAPSIWNQISNWMSPNHPVQTALNPPPWSGDHTSNDEESIVRRGRPRSRNSERQQVSYDPHHMDLRGYPFRR